MKPTSNKRVIQDYWESKLPQSWYSEKEKGTKEYYDELESERYSRHYPDLLVDAEFDLHSGEDVLEIGCGMGTDSLMFAKGGANVFGVDLTETAPATCQERFGLYGLEGNFQRMDAENLEFEDNRFDHVYSFGVLHHTPDTQKAIMEVHRVLKPGKRAIIMLYAKDWQYYIFSPLYHGIIKGELFSMSRTEMLHKHCEVHGNVPLTRRYNKSPVLDLFSAFSNVEVWRRPGRYKITDKVPNEWLVRKLERLWGSNWMIRATK
jgi:ubiquinone/menaquinone biosynthesis C-methylase UbiE